MGSDVRDEVPEPIGKAWPTKREIVEPSVLVCPITQTMPLGDDGKRELMLYSYVEPRVDMDIEAACEISPGTTTRSSFLRVATPTSVMRWSSTGRPACRRGTP